MIEPEECLADILMAEVTDLQKKIDDRDQIIARLRADLLAAIARLDQALRQ